MLIELGVSFGSCTSSYKENLSDSKASRYRAHNPCWQSFPFCSALLPCLVAFPLISQAICSKMCQFLFKRLGNFHRYILILLVRRVFVFFYNSFYLFQVYSRANVIVGARQQAHGVHTNTRNIHVISGLVL